MTNTDKQPFGFATAPSLMALSILIVEDDEDDASIIADAIKEFYPAFAVTCLSKGGMVTQYLQAIKEEDLPSLIILDYNMAPVTGIEVLRTLKASDRYKHIPVTVYSHSTFPRHKEECMNAGACIYLSKSSTIKNVYEDVRVMLSYCLHR